MWSDVRDGINAYEISRKFSGKVLLETLTVALFIGIYSRSLWVGVISFFVTLILWSVPFIGTAMMIGFSAFYAYVAYTILSCIYLPSAICFGIAAFIFFMSFVGHFATVGH